MRLKADAGTSPAPAGLLFCPQRPIAGPKTPPAQKPGYFRAAVKEPKGHVRARGAWGAGPGPPPGHGDVVFSYVIADAYALTPARRRSCTAASSKALRLCRGAPVVCHLAPHRMHRVSPASRPQASRGALGRTPVGACGRRGPSLRFCRTIRGLHREFSALKAADAVRLLER